MIILGNMLLRYLGYLLTFKIKLLKGHFLTIPAVPIILFKDNTFKDNTYNYQGRVWPRICIMVVLTEKMGMFLCQFVCCAFATKATAKNPAQKWSYNSGFIFLANLFVTKYHYCLNKIINLRIVNTYLISTRFMLMYLKRKVQRVFILRKLESYLTYKISRKMSMYYS